LLKGQGLLQESLAPSGFHFFNLLSTLLIIHFLIVLISIYEFQRVRFAG